MDSLSYETAKRLKEKGFPQKLRLGTWACEHGLEKVMQNSCKCWGDMLSYAPPLEELIEACGDKFDNLYQVREEGIGNWWQAYMTKTEFKRQEIPCDYHCDGYSAGDTPSEAVAALWEALKK